MDKVSCLTHSWWMEVRKQDAEYYKAGQFLKLPASAGKKAGAFHRSGEVLYVREIFSRLFEDICHVLQEDWMCHLNGNSGVGKSSFLWYFIARSGIQYPLRVIVLETEAAVWEFGPTGANARFKRDAPIDRVIQDDVYYHLVDQRVDTSRPMGSRVLVASSPDVSNIKYARKIRDTVIRYMPVWSLSEITSLLAWWREKLTTLQEGSRDREVLTKRLDAAEVAYSWFGGVPRSILGEGAENLTDAQFCAEVSRSLVDTNMENIRAAVFDHRSSSRLFHFNLRPGSLQDFYYTFSSDKVAQLSANYLLLTNRRQLELFMYASETIPEYGALRDFVFEQYVIERCLKQEVVGVKLLDVSQADDLRLWYYRGELEDALMAAGKDAEKYLFRPLAKNNAVFDFVKPPCTLGLITISLTHPPAIEALGKAVKALKAWGSVFDQSNRDKDILLLFLLPPSRFHKFKFQRYRKAGKVSTVAVKGVIQSKVAVPVSGTCSFSHDLKPATMEEVTLDLAADEKSWETSLRCQETPKSASWVDTELVPLDGERERLMKLSCVQDIPEFLKKKINKLESLTYKEIQGLCKQLGIRANAKREILTADLKTHAANMPAMDEDEDVDEDEDEDDMDVDT